MKAFWKTCIIFLAIIAPALAHHHHQGSNLAHILAAGLIVQMLSHHGHHKHHHGHHHHGHHHHGHESRHNPGYAAFHHQQYRTPEWPVQEARIQPDLFPEQKNPWAHNNQMNFGFGNGQFQQPALDAFNVPSLYSQHQPLFPPF